MKTLAATFAAVGALLVFAGDGAKMPGAWSSTPSAPSPGEGLLDNELIREYCVRCHSDARLRGNMSLEGFDADAPEERAELAEKMIVKLRAGMMPPPGVSRPAGDSLDALAASLETRIDAAAAENPNPGGRTFQRLNRVEYERSIEELLGLRVSAGDYLPLDTKSENFDNIADVQMMSPTLLDAYLNAAAEISRIAVGDVAAVPTDDTYSVSGYTSQLERSVGAPFGTRGGVSVVHNFPAAGELQTITGAEPVEEIGGTDHVAGSLLAFGAFRRRSYSTRFGIFLAT